MESIRKQSYPSVEVIVVDQESQDRTLSISKGFNAKIITTTPTKIYAPPSKSRNIGSKMAKGRYLLHLDSDMELTKELVEECVNRLDNSGLGSIVIHEIDVAEGFWGRCKALERKCIIGDPYLEGARFVKSDVFHMVGGYDEALSFGEDWSVHQKYKKVAGVGVAEAVIRHHVGSISLSEQVRKKYGYGKTAGSYLKKYPRESKMQLLFRSAYLRNWNLLMDNPIHALGFIFMKSCEYCATVLGLLMSKVDKKREESG